MSRYSIALSLTLVSLLAACGGGGGQLVADGRPLDPLTEGTPGPSLLRPGDSLQAPVVALGGRVHVGADVAPPAGALLPSARHGAAAVSYGTVEDGVGAEELRAYLEADASSLTNEQYPDGYTRRFGARPPVVRVAEGATAELIGETVRAVQLINASLPHDWRLRVSDDPGPDDLFRPADGEILVEFAALEEWSHPDEQPDGRVGLARWWSEGIRADEAPHPWIFTTVSGHVWIDHTRHTGRDLLETLVHELLHSLGRRHPDASRFPDTIMSTLHPESGERIGSSGPLGHVLHPLDREALHAVYGRIKPSAAPHRIADDLGSWAATSHHIRGVVHVPGGDIAFGVAWNNGLSRPWTSGLKPATTPASNPELSGSASWSGRLLGFTSAMDSVGGEARLDVDLESLTGRLNLTGLETWAAHMPPGEVGTGTAWGGGDLAYSIAIRGNTFSQSGGDEGVVTGVFFGPTHEGMGGTLQRDDLTASFAGTR